MMSVRLLAVCMLVAGMIPMAFGAPARIGSTGEAVVDFDADLGLSGFRITVGDVAFNPLAGACLLNEANEPAPSMRVDMDAAIEGDVLRVAVTSPEPTARGVDPGKVEGLGEWRRLHLSRQTAAYGQTWWPGTFYSVKGDFWFTVHWVLEESDATEWKALDQAASGSGTFPAALQLRYLPDTEGTFLPIHEVLEIRISKSLWDVVPMPRQNPSEYREELAKSVYIDFWGGHAASELAHFLGVMKRVARDDLRFLTILQNWQVGGWDALLPDSVWMPDYPPNPAVGTVAELRALCELGQSVGRFGFRTNYRQLAENCPSFKTGLAHFAVDPEGKSRGHLRAADWPAVAGRQEKQIDELFGSDASFTDELTAGAIPSAWHDFAPDGNRSMRASLQRQKELANLIRTAHKGPLGSESLMDQALLGEYIDSGDFTFMNGHNRFYSPEFKLRRLHHLSTFHGMGLMYRFFEFPPFDDYHSGKQPYKTDQSLLDDYRCCEIMFGNGAYVCYPFANWRYYLTECLLVGNLQRYYALAGVRNVLYQDGERWLTLEEMVRGGTVPNVVPWIPQTRQFGRIRTEYETGLNVVVNRLDDPLEVDCGEAGRIVLPRSGWAAWTQDGKVLAFSAYWPGTESRVDYLRDDNRLIEYIDPREATVKGLSLPTLLSDGQPVVVVDPEENEVRVDGETLALTLPEPEPLMTLSFEFGESIEGWRPAAGILTARIADGALVLHTIAADPQMYSPALRIDGDVAKAIDIRMRLSEGKAAQLYFETEAAPGISGEKAMYFDVIPDGEFHTYRLEVTNHPNWRGQTITGIRFDPVHGPAEADIEIDYIRQVPGG